MTTLERINRLLQNLRSHPGKIDKTNILRGCMGQSDIADMVKALLKMTYCPFIHFYIQPAELNKTVRGFKESEMMEMAPDLKFMKVVGYMTTYQCRGDNGIAISKLFLNIHPEFRELYINVLSRDLKCGLTPDIINKVIPGLIQDFKVSQGVGANTYGYPDFEKEQWFCGRRFGGFRAVTLKDRKLVQTRSVSNQVIMTLRKTEKMMEIIDVEKYSFEGEYCIVDNAGIESFKIAQNVIPARTPIEFPRYYMYDMFTPEEFRNGRSSRKYSERLEKLKEWIEDLPPDYVDNFIYAKQIPVKSIAHLDDLIKGAKERGWEGVILRKNSAYEAGVTKNIRFIDFKTLKGDEE